MITPTIVSKIYRLANESGLIQEEDTAVVFIDYHILQSRLSALKKAFPPQSLHTVAVKSNPLLACLKEINRLSTGLEVASMGELMLAKAAGVPTSHIVFDSPVKTRKEIEQILNEFEGLIVNANNLMELSRYPKEQLTLKLGLRINPEVNAPSYKYLSVGSRGSKFGESISNRKIIVENLIMHPGVSGLHVHTGSQISTLKTAVLGIRRVMDLALEINDKVGTQKINYIDIGGGFPVNYKTDEPYEINNYVDEIHKACPELFNTTFQIITEFGRYVHAHAGWVASDVEYVQPNTETPNLLLHVGADMFLRECYNPGDWFHKLLLLNRDGILKEDNAKKAYNLTGPLCFGGDVIDRNRTLPFVVPGDKLIILDAGANSYGLWSRHCSRPFPKIISYNGSMTDPNLKIIKDREKFNDIIKFWS